MTDLEKGFIDFKENAIEKYPVIEDIMRDFLQQYTSDTVYIKYDAIDETIRIELHTKEGNMYYSYYENKHIVLYAVVSAFTNIVNPENVATLALVLTFSTIEEYFMSLINAGILKLVQEAENWETVI